jgi:hypothetical protein
MDLLTFVTSKYIDQLDRPGADTDQEWARHALDVAMEQEEAGPRPVATRRELLTAYLRLAVEDLDVLPIRVHEWFLEQICNSAELPEVNDLGGRISRTYFLSGAGLYRYICLSALLSLDERLQDRDKTHVRSIWAFILDVHNFEGWNKSAMIGELTDILIDVGHLTAHPRYADQAVRELWADVREFREIQIEIEERVRETAERSGAERSAALLHLIRRPER